MVEKRVLWPQLALGLYVASLFLPAIQWADSIVSGYAALNMTFLGIYFFSWEPSPARLGPALLICVLGALANVLMLLGYVGVLARLQVFSRLVATSAVLVALAVIPLAGGVMGNRQSGYVLWVGTAVILASAAWLLPFSPVEQPTLADCPDGIG
jgi:hypothetical protein